MISEKHRGSLWLYFLIAVLMIFISCLMQFFFTRYIDVGKENLPVSGFSPRGLILDAGHGGRDGGAVSITGTPEKELNLQITRRLSALFTALGYSVTETREGDESLSVPGSTASRKMQDLKARLLVAEAHPDLPFVSIHMNKFPQSRYRGLQVYYSPNREESREMAEAVRKAVKEILQPENDRETKKAGSAIFLLDKIKSPAVLIECGFLSNSEEAKALEDPDYQRRLCLVLLSAFTAVRES